MGGFIANNNKLLKSVGGPWDLYKAHPLQFDKGVVRGYPLVLMGHNRWATQGGVNEENAHPFEYESIVGAHNGTVSRESIKDFHNAKEFDVDSQIIFSQIDQDPDLFQVWKAVRGAMALVWYEKEEKQLHFARNKERSFNYTINKNGKTLYWASEAWMLHIALGRAGIEHGEVISTKVDHHYTILQEKQDLIIEEEPIIKPKTFLGDGGVKKEPKQEPERKTEEVKTETRKSGRGKDVNEYYIIEEFVEDKLCTAKGYFLGKTLKGKDIKIQIPYFRHKELCEEVMAAGKTAVWMIPMVNLTDRGNFLEILGSDFFKAKKLPVKLVESSKPKGEILGFKGVLLTAEEYNNRIKEGCLNCKCNNFHLEDAENIVWVNETTYLCETCFEDPYVKQLINSLKEEA